MNRPFISISGMLEVLALYFDAQDLKNKDQPVVANGEVQNDLRKLADYLREHALLDDELFRALGD